SHGLIPPHPGPMAALAALHADAGRTILFGLLVGAPTAILAGFVFSRVNCGADSADVPPLIAARIAPPKGAPGLWTALFIILLPVGLMILGAGAQVMLSDPQALHPELDFAESSIVGSLRRWLLFAGDPVVAMLIAVLVSFYTLGLARGFSRRQIMG